MKVVVVGGLDPTGGAGVLRDFWAADRLQAACRVVVTAWTRQGAETFARTDTLSSAEPFAIDPRSPELVADELRLALDGASAVKLGMMVSRAHVAALAPVLAAFSGPVVCDPVLRASGGGDLFVDDPATGYAPLLSRIDLLTPNLDEAARFCSQPVATVSEAEEVGRALVARNVRAVLIKGGHYPGAPTDVLVDNSGVTFFSGERIEGPSPRGTGCALATALAVALARGDSMTKAVASSKQWLSERIKAARAVAGAWHLG